MAAASRGMTLIELLVGMAVASLVATVVMTGLSSLGRVHRRGLEAGRDEAWLVLAAMASDSTCIDNETCRRHWRVRDALQHFDGDWQPYSNSVASIDFVADERTPTLLTIRLVLRDGRRYERAVVRP